MCSNSTSFSNRTVGDVDVLLNDGVCLKVPFNRVTIKKSKESSQPNDMLDFAGVSDVQQNYVGTMAC